jgi:hypothetical protein
MSAAELPAIILSNFGRRLSGALGPEKAALRTA